jgi:hypothetical protein
VVTYRGLEFDPTPGRRDDVGQAITQLVSAADALASVEPALRDAARHSQGWRGAAAEAFRTRLAATPRDFHTRERSLRDAVAVLASWAGTLAENQRLTEELDAAAVRIRARLRAARDDVADKQNALDLAATPAGAAGASIELSGARGRVADLEQELADVLARARALARDHLRAAEETAEALPGGGPPAPRPASLAVRALAGMLDTASATSATLAAVLSWPGSSSAADVPAGARPAAGSAGSGAAGAFAGALSGGVLRPSGELIVFGETPLRPGGGS